VRRGEVRWGVPPLSGGDRKRRRFLIVSNDAFNVNERYTKVMVVHLTSVQHLGGPYDWEVAVPRGTARLSKASIIKCAEVYTLLKSQLGEVIGTLPREILARVDRALATALGLPA
jgi:mRNA-degrading endonuclease toxin of MazEF toxin-antitoxin module